MLITILCTSPGVQKKFQSLDKIILILLLISICRFFISYKLHVYIERFQYNQIK